MVSKLALLALIPAVLAVDTSSHCGKCFPLRCLCCANVRYPGQWDEVSASPYTLFLDQWGLSDATSGSDCASLTTLSGSTIAWTTTWTWTGGTSVKSFTNINVNSNINKQLSAISTIPVSTILFPDDTSSHFPTNSPSGPGRRRPLAPSSPTSPMTCSPRRRPEALQPTR